VTFNAFLKQDVDSIAYSHYDADSLYHSEWITRLIYIADSIYQIYFDFGYWGWGRNRGYGLSVRAVCP